MQKLSRYNHGINFVFVAVNTSNRLVWVLPLRKKTASEFKNALQKIIEALRARKYSWTEMMKSKFLRLNSKTEPKPEKIWVDKGREFAGEFSQFCRKNDIELHSTHNETKSAFAERNIRSLRAIIFKFLHENNRHIYRKFTAIRKRDCRVNRTTKLAPKDVEKTDVLYLISLQTSRQIREPKCKIGQQARIKREIGTIHRGYRIQFKEEGFTFTAIQTLNPREYTVKMPWISWTKANSTNPNWPSFKNGFFEIFLTNNPSNTMSLREFTINWVSNASMATFPEKTLAFFTSILPQELDLTGFGEVALTEIAWPAAIQNIASGHFKYRVAPEAQKDNGISDSSSTYTRKRKLNAMPYGKVTMCELPIRPVIIIRPAAIS